MTPLCQLPGVSRLHPHAVIDPEAHPVVRQGLQHCFHWRRRDKLLSVITHTLRAPRFLTSCRRKTGGEPEERERRTGGERGEPGERERRTGGEREEKEEKQRRTGGEREENRRREREENGGERERGEPEERERGEPGKRERRTGGEREENRRRERRTGGEHIHITSPRFLMT
ncbi:Translation initiation factor IF-2 [Dissostichus eleginoides]|uniref:Translation initiation factor IF-2 n=1 Tax=Dissostichus eleginoides TaxID=100907 RepID=A0AAD9B1P1_DISEL|nr:Translation initiation factor IF-2 [Dissostichus eleginoides]